MVSMYKNCLTLWHENDKVVKNLGQVNYTMRNQVIPFSYNMRNLKIETMMLGIHYWM